MNRSDVCKHGYRISQNRNRTTSGQLFNPIQYETIHIWKQRLRNRVHKVKAASELGRDHTEVLVESLGELVQGRRDLKPEFKNSLLPQKIDLFGPPD